MKMEGGREGGREGGLVAYLFLLYTQAYDNLAETPMKGKRERSGFM